MHRIIALVVILISFIGSEVFFYVYLANEINSSILYKILYFGTLSLFVVTLFSAFTDDQKNREGIKSYTKNFLFGLAFTIFVTKLTFVLVALLGEAVSGLLYLLDIGDVIQRRTWIKILGLVIAAFPFISFLYGITKGKYNYKVIKVPLYFSDLPKEFDGYKVVQISDIHSGSFDSKKQVKKGIDLINQQDADLVLFTGDLVNNFADEIEPFIPLFKEIQAKDGKFSITGNHDYADYVRWHSIEDKQKNFQQLVTNHGKMDFKILMNEHVKIQRGTSEIAVVGIENWGLPPFPQFGDLNKAIENLAVNSFKLLLSHDPSHWDAQVVEHAVNFNLTLSGHTHGMQVGFDIKKIIKWSPVKYKYPKWAGLYENNQQYLYVNKGFGFLGFPGRVGMWPEITVFELKKQ
ncbi:MAG: metallophosphoesterase [Flavobacteriales bacterium]|jgi:predicted MPP superfamily phosphohydrolase|nr:metallophosphoesterase [Flavobacteriales bacterium]